MENKEIALLEKKVNNALDLSQSLEINSNNTLEGGIDFLKKIKVVGKALKQQKDKLLIPARGVVTGIREMFKPAEENYAEAEKNVKKKILDYNLKVEKENAEKERKLAERVESGNLKPETAAKKMEDIKETSKEGKIGKVSTKTIRKVVITDPKKLPREYLMPNETLIRKDALSGVKIAGVEIKEEKIIASY